MLSRVANSIYWLSRYVERAENVARFLNVNFNLSLGKGEPIREQWAPLVSITGDESSFNEYYDTGNRRNVLQFLTLDRRNPNSIVSCVEAARENARSVREVLPVSIWEQLNKFYHLVHAEMEAGELIEPNHFCEQVKLASHVIDGMTESIISHGDEWHFARLGRLIERADKTSRIVDTQYFLLLPDPNDVGSAIDVVRWCSLLKSTTALSTYRRRHGGILPNKVAEFLILDRNFPRSLHFCLSHAQSSLQAVARTNSDNFHFRSEQCLGRLRSELDYTSIDDVIGQGLHKFIDEFQTQLNQIDDAIHGDFFTMPDRINHPRTIYHRDIQLQA